MKNICLYFQVHQPFRLNSYSFFQIGSDEAYFDDMMNRDILRRVAYNCYLPFNGLLLRLIEATGYRLQVSFSLSSTVIEQLLWYAPEVLDSFRALVATGCVELLGETAAHSLAAIVSEKEFREQVRAHTHLIYDVFGQMPQTFRNTELIYADSIAPIINDLGFDTILADAGHDVLQWRSSNYIYGAAGCPAVKLLLKNGQLSDDIAFRFADRGWKEWPLSPDRYISWLNAIPGNEQLLNLFMDYETFGEHMPASSGIYEFMEMFILQALAAGYTFITPQAAGALLPVKAVISIPSYTSWADTEKDLSAWLGNDMQRDAFDTLYGLEEQVRQIKNEPDIYTIWKRLQNSDHFYYMSTKGLSDGDVHRYFSPYSSPFEAFINYMNILTDFSAKVAERSKKRLSCKGMYI